MEFTKVPYTVMKQPSLYHGVMSNYKVEIQIPVDAPPSCRGKVVDVYWILKAVLDAKKHFYWTVKEAEVPIQVKSTPNSSRGAMADLPEEKNFKDCDLSLEVPDITVSRGAVSGSFRVKALREFQVRGIMIELRQIENIGSGNVVNNVIAQQELSGSVSFNTTNSSPFTFSLPLPADALPTTVTPHSSLRWQVRAFLDRKMRKDISIERDVIIYTGMPIEAISTSNTQ